MILRNNYIPVHHTCKHADGWYLKQWSSAFLMQSSATLTQIPPNLWIPIMLFEEFVCKKTFGSTTLCEKLIRSPLAKWYLYIASMLTVEAKVSNILVLKKNDFDFFFHSTDCHAYEKLHTTFVYSTLTLEEWYQNKSYHSPLTWGDENRGRTRPLVRGKVREKSHKGA